MRARHLCALCCGLFVSLLAFAILSSRGHAASSQPLAPVPPGVGPLRVRVLTCGWVGERAAAAGATCAALPPGTCAVVDAPRGDALSPDQLAGFAAAGVVSLAPTPEPPLLRRLLPLPKLLQPLFAEYPLNQMVVSPRAAKTVANTVGAVNIIREFAAFTHDPSLPPPLLVFLEDDAQIVRPDSFPAELAALVAELSRGGAAASSSSPPANTNSTAAAARRVASVAVAHPDPWHLLSLFPSPGLCDTARRSPWLPPSGLLRTRRSFSRSTALAFSVTGARVLVESLPATNTIDLWLRELMKNGILMVHVHCGEQPMVVLGNTSQRQVR